MANAHNLIANLKLNSGQFDKNMNKSRTGMTRFGKDVKGLGKQMLAIAGIGGGLYAIQRGFKSVVQAASDLQETQSKFNVVFRGMSKEANKWAVGFGDSVGRSENAVKSWMARLQDTFVPLGFAREEAMKMSQEIAKLAVDVASFNNAADADVIRDFTSALVGNHETVRKFGIIISENRLKQDAMNAGLGDSYKNLTDLEKVQLRFNALLADTKDAQGDAGRTAGEYANQLKRTKANWEELKATIGGVVLPPISSLLETVNTARDNAADAFQNYRKRNEVDAITGVIITEEDKESAEFDAFARKWEKKNSAFSAQIKLQNEQRTTANEISKVYVDNINKEIQLTGMVGEARQRASKMIEMENKLKVAGIEDTIHGKKAVEDLAAALEKLKGAQQLARIAEDIGSAFADAFTDMIFEAKRFGDVMKALMKDIARSVVKNVITTPLANSITMALGGVPAAVGHSGGTFGSIGARRNVPSTTFAGAPRLHGGLKGDEFPAILQKGEEVIPKGGGGGGTTVIINNNTGQKMKQDGPAQFNGREMVIQIVADDVQSGGQLSKLFKR